MPNKAHPADSKKKTNLMEQLKELADIGKPDPRNLYFVVTDKGGAAKQLSLESIHNFVSSIKLHNTVPDEIKSHFSQAQNLAVYSWFHYPFNVTSQFMGFVTVELALKNKTGKKTNFKNLIREAVEKGWIKNKGFTIAKDSHDSENSYVETLIEVMPSLRNKLAHGSNMLHNSSISSLLICAEFINQLYENP